MRFARGSLADLPSEYGRIPLPPMEVARKTKQWIFGNAFGLFGIASFCLAIGGLVL